MTPPELAAAAAVLAEQGVPVFPCLESKIPATPRGFKDWVSDPAKARHLFLYTRGAALIGMPTGVPSGISAIDIDPQGKAWFVAKQRRLPETRVHQTRRGGYHLLFRHPPGLRNSASKISFGVDVRGEGGYIIIPPSPGYAVINEGDLAYFPKWVLRGLIKSEEKAKTHRAESSDLDTALLERFVSESREGQRNVRLFWAACRLGEGGKTSSADSLIRAAISAGLDAVEATRTVSNGLVARPRPGARSN